jgi:mxaA protein
MTRIRPTIGAAMIATAIAATIAATSASAEPATVQQPRAFGHVLGDIVTQQVLLDSGPHADELSAMPSTGRVNAWLERRPPSFRTDADGRRWLVLDYQVMNSPRAPAMTSTPPLQLRLASGKTLDVAESPLSIAPLAPLGLADTGRLAGLQPDRLLAPASTAPVQRALLIWSALTVAVLIAWLGWWIWRNRRDARQLPFAKAWARFGRHDDAALDANPDAWRGLHRALDEAAGQVVLAGSVPRLTQSAPHLRELQPQLEQFFQRSTDRFFSDLSPPTPFSLRELYRALYRAERRHHR